MGENARAAIISRGIKEVTRIVVSLGGKKETVLAGLGTEIDSLSAQMVTKLFAGRA